MEPAEPAGGVPDPQLGSQPPEWTYPTRFCRICREDVPATVTMYPPGLPMQFQTPIVEYKNEDEYGRLIKPCKCKGSLRYIHELCLLRSRTENNRAGSMWKCHECGHQFNFQRLDIQRFLSSRVAVTALTVLFMVFVVFVLGFVADPIINIYMDPYDSLMGNESIWDELEVRTPRQNAVSAWSQHFAKGFISMGLVGFLKSLLLNPFQWVNLRFGSSLSSTRATTGRDRAVNISWIAIAIGVCSAFVLFYRWVQAIVQRSLQRIANNIVDTQLPGDDDDLKPPSGRKRYTAEAPATPRTQHKEGEAFVTTGQQDHVDESSRIIAEGNADPIIGASRADEEQQAKEQAEDEVQDVPPRSTSTPSMSGSWVAIDDGADDDNDKLAGAHRQGWSFSNL